MKYRLTLLVEEQQEGGYTITCRELPELITECDSLDDMISTVKDAFVAVVELYEYRGRSLPPDILLPDAAVKEDRDLIETVVAFHEVPPSNPKTKTAGL